MPTRAFPLCLAVGQQFLCVLNASLLGIHIASTCFKYGIQFELFIKSMFLLYPKEVRMN